MCYHLLVKSEGADGVNHVQVPPVSDCACFSGRWQSPLPAPGVRGHTARSTSNRQMSQIFLKAVKRDAIAVFNTVVCHWFGFYPGGFRSNINLFWTCFYETLTVGWEEKHKPTIKNQQGCKYGYYSICQKSDQVLSPSPNLWVSSSSPNKIILSHTCTHTRGS